LNLRLFICDVSTLTGWEDDHECITGMHVQVSVSEFAWRDTEWRSL